MTLEIDLKFIKWRPYTQFQLNVSKNVREKCGKLCIKFSSIGSSRKGITPTKSDENWRHSNLICSTIKQSHMLNDSLICSSKYEKSAENCVFPVF